MDWCAIKAEYITDASSSYRRLAAKFNIPEMKNINKINLKVDIHELKSVNFFICKKFIDVIVLKYVVICDRSRWLLG